MISFSIGPDMNILDKPITLHSWYLALKSTWKMFKKFKDQVWWTQEEFQGLCHKDENGNKKYPVCPKCGKDQLDVD